MRRRDLRPDLIEHPELITQVCATRFESRGELSVGAGERGREPLPASDPQVSHIVSSIVRGHIGQNMFCCWLIWKSPRVNHERCSNEAGKLPSSDG